MRNPGTAYLIPVGSFAAPVRVVELSKLSPDFAIVPQSFVLAVSNL